MAPGAGGGRLNSGYSGDAGGMVGAVAWGGTAWGAPGCTGAGAAGAAAAAAAEEAGAGEPSSSYWFCLASASVVLPGVASSQGASFAGSVFCTQAAGTSAKAHRHEATIRPQGLEGLKVIDPASGHETANRCNRDMLT